MQKVVAFSEADFLRLRKLVRAFEGKGGETSLLRGGPRRQWMRGAEVIRVTSTATLESGGFTLWPAKIRIFDDDTPVFGDDSVDIWAVEPDHADLSVRSYAGVGPIGAREGRPVYAAFDPNLSGSSLSSTVGGGGDDGSGGGGGG